MLGLRAEIEGDPLDREVPEADHDDLRRPGVAVDPDPSRALELRLLDPRAARPGDDVDRRDRLGAVGECRDRLGAADRVDRIGPGRGRRGEHRGRRLAGLALGWRGDDDPPDAGDAGRDDPHDDARRIRSAAAGDVDAGGADRHLGDLDPLAGAEGHGCGLADLGLRDRADVGDADVDRFAKLIGDGIAGGGDPL